MDLAALQADSGIIPASSVVTNASLTAGDVTAKWTAMGPKTSLTASTSVPTQLIIAVRTPDCASIITTSVTVPMTVRTGKMSATVDTSHGREREDCQSIRTKHDQPAASNQPIR